MNSIIHTTAAAAAARDAAFELAMGGLETPVRHLRILTEILGDMLDDTLVQYDPKTGEKTCVPGKGGNLRVIISEGEMDRLSFLWNEVIIRACALERDFDNALSGKAVAA